MVTARGNALPETALVLSTVLLLLIGGLRLALIGYTQLAGDGAAFTAARLSGVGDPNAVQKTVTAVPRVRTGDISTQSGLPPVASEPTNYNVGDEDDRHGGVTMIQPAQIIALVTTSDLDGLLIGSSAVTLNSVSYAPQYLDFNAHFDVMGDDVNSAGSLTGAQDYFTNGENVPPYFVGFHYMEYCEVSFESGSWSTCPGVQDWAALGLAEYLDDDNWDRSQPGVGGSGAVFGEMLCHQDQFAAVASLAYAAPDIATAAQTLTDSQSNIATIYSWDSRTPGGYPPSNYTGPGSYPLHPDAGC